MLMSLKKMIRRLRFRLSSKDRKKLQKTDIAVQRAAEHFLTDGRSRSRASNSVEECWRFRVRRKCHLQKSLHGHMRWSANNRQRKTWMASPHDARGNKRREGQWIGPCDHSTRNHLCCSNSFNRVRRLGVSNWVCPLQTKRCQFSCFSRRRVTCTWR